MPHEIPLIVPRGGVRATNSYTPQYSESLGIGYIAAVLSEAGWRVRILDMEVDHLDVAAVVSQLGDDPLLAGISLVSDRTIGVARELAGEIKARFPATHVVAGGHCASAAADELLQSSLFDSVVHGEGEVTILELAHRIESGRLPTGLLGVSTRVGKAIADGGRRAPIEDLDSLPRPARYNLERIRDAGERVGVSSSRGCFGRCSFCTLASFSGRWRARSTAVVVDELESLASRGVSSVAFVDENYLGHCPAGRQRALSIGQEILRRQLRINYKICCRADDLDREIVAALRRSGMRTVSCGIESFTQRQLRLYRKETRPGDALRLASLARELRVKIRFSFIMFDPYVTLDDLDENVTMMEQCPECFTHKRLLTRLVLLPGTPLRRKVAADGLLKDAVDFEFADHLAAAVWDHLAASTERLSALDELIATALEVIAQRRQDVTRRRDDMCDLVQEDTAVATARQLLFQGTLAAFRAALARAGKPQRREAESYTRESDRRLEEAARLLERVICSEAKGGQLTVSSASLARSGDEPSATARSSTP